jgi:hypothetical protein
VLLRRSAFLPGKDGLVRMTLKPAFSDGTVAIDRNPLSLLCRLAAAVPTARTPKWSNYLSFNEASSSVCAMKPLAKQVSPGGSSLTHVTRSGFAGQTVPAIGYQRLGAQLRNHSLQLGTATFAECTNVLVVDVLAARTAKPKPSNDTNYHAGNEDRAADREHALAVSELSKDVNRHAACNARPTGSAQRYCMPSNFCEFGSGIIVQLGHG